MNLYFLLEGRRTEPKIYPSWFKSLLPSYTRVNTPSTITENNYFLISGKGFPSLLHNHLRNSIEDINEVGLFNYLVIILDAENETVDARIAEVQNYIIENNLKLDCDLKIIVQNKCIETWLLGNNRIFSRQPSSGELIRYKRYFNVLTENPELMESIDESSVGEFHFRYLKLLLAEKNIQYTKKYPRDTAEEHYLRQIQARTSRNPDHLQSFQHLIRFCSEVMSKT